MNAQTSKKLWAQPAINSVERMKDAAGNSGTGIRKGSALTEFLYDGPGS